MKLKWGPPALAILFAVTVEGRVADAADEDVVEYRQSVMKLMDAHVDAITTVVRGQVAFTDHVAAHAASIEQLSTTIIDLFPAETGPAALPTSALQEIWSDKAGFEAAALALQQAATNLSLAAQTGDHVAIATEFNNLRRGGCDACHTSFRRRPSQ